MLASAVSRWRQKVSVPPCAAPSPRTFFRGVAMLEAPPQRIASVPDEDRERDREDDGEPSEHLDARLVERPAGIPDQVADAAKHVMDERPGEQKEHDAPCDAGNEVRDLGEGVRPGGNRDEPPGEEDEANRVRRA